MSTNERTPWFPADVKPVREGLYECGICGARHWHYWNGQFWINDDTPGSWRLAAAFPWRGLAKKPT